MIESITDYIKNKITEIEKYNEEYKFDTNELIIGRRMTNIGTFRAYIKEYLRRKKRHPSFKQ